MYSTLNGEEKSDKVHQYNELCLKCPKPSEERIFLVVLVRTKATVAQKGRECPQ